MKNILVVFTGGTIGSTATDGNINTSTDAPSKLLALFQHRYKTQQSIRFKTIRPLQILSENLAPSAWSLLIKAIETENNGQYDGIIITHGTDTLAFTAAALSFYFATTEVPILLVSSNYPLDNPNANGLDNFICAIEFILQQHQGGIFVPYRNPQQATQLHSGTRLAASPQLSGDFYSVQNRSYMQFENHQFSLLNSLPEPSNTNRLKAAFSQRILLIKPYPGLDYSYFNLKSIDVVLHDLYHSGTACSSTQWGDNLSLLNFIQRCREQGIKVYMAPAIKSDNAYESTRALINEGATMIWNMSLECAYAKLLLAYGNFNDEQEILDFLNEDFAGEHVQSV
ncbi:MAG: asparaginase [Methylococcaceae bacterium]|nr:asparaginase [Methylococcaceae bacterium]